MSESGDASLDPPSPLVGSNALDLRREVNIKLCNSFISLISDGSQLQFVRSDLLGIVMAPESSACLSNAALNASHRQRSLYSASRTIFTLSSVIVESIGNVTTYSRPSNLAL